MSEAAEKELRLQWQTSHDNVHELEQRALQAALASSNQRLDEMNKLRTQIDQERGVYVRRDTFDTTNSSIDTRLKLLENKQANNEGRMWVIGAIVIIINILLVYWKK